MKTYYYNVIGGTDPAVEQMEKIPLIRQKCKDLLIAKYYKTIKHNSDLYNKDILKFKNLEDIYNEILKVKQIKAERKAKLAQAHKDFK